LCSSFSMRIKVMATFSIPGKYFAGLAKTCCCDACVVLVEAVALSFYIPSDP
jgi:hypothetical protein